MIPRRPHVFMTTDSVGGVWTYATDLSAGLIAHGIDVTLVLLGPAPRPDQRQSLHPAITLLETGLPLDWLANGEHDLATPAQTLATLAQGASLIHLNTPAYAAHTRFSAPVIGVCHSCLPTWWDAVRTTPLPPHFAWHHTQLAKAYAACDALIAPSQSFATATAARFGIHPIVIPNGRATPPRTSTPKRPIVLTSGRLWDEGKNIAALDRAASLMRGQVQAAGPLIGPFTNPGSAQATLQTIAHLGILNAPTMATHLAEAAVFASLARYEPFGLGVLEAAQAGCALVLSDIPTFRELWSGAALFVDPDNPPATAATLDRLLENPAEANDLGHRAAARATRFTLDAMVQSTLAAYARLLHPLEQVA